MSESSGKAVFLSYASQDAEAARRICDTLRASGIEVWFDVEGGLEHGDEWDAKIRRQIKECVLFIPLISASTQARHEGYFRIEWELAAQRAMGIAGGVPFILPVVIDDTREPAALVPDRFRAVQWTKLRGGEVPPEVQQRFLKLWSQRAGIVAPDQIAGPVSLSSLPHAGTNASAAPSPKRARVGIVGALLATALTIGGYFWLKGPPARTSPTGPIGEKPAPARSESRQLSDHAYAVVNRFSYTREELAAAEDLARRATTLEQDSAYAWGVLAAMHGTFVNRNWDRSQRRKQDTETSARRALAIDPDEPHALIALTTILGPKDAEPLVRRALRAAPNDRMALITAAYVFPSDAERTAMIEAALRRDPSDPLPRYALALKHAASGRKPTIDDLATALRELDTILGQQLWENALFLKAWLLIGWKGDLAGMRDVLDAIDRLPLFGRAEDQPLFTTMLGALYDQNPKRTLAAASLTTRTYFEHTLIASPKAWLTALAHTLNGQPGQARVEWQAAEKVLRERLHETPDAQREQSQLAVTLAWLGNADQAKSLAAPLEAIAEETNDISLNVELARTYSGLRDANRAVPFLRRALNRTGRHTDHTLLLDPWWIPLRGQPAFEALLTEARARSAATSTPAATAPSVSADKSVAVLAFADLSEKKDNEAFSDGLADELLTTLKKIPGLRVAARTSAFSFKGKSVTAKEVGEKLGTAHVVEGSVMKFGSRWKVTARLSRAETNEQMWSQDFGPFEMTDVFAMQSELTQAIVAELRGRLTGEAATAANAEIQAQVQAATRGGTKNSEAFQLYLQGRFHALRANPADVARGADFYERAVATDSSFATAWAALARARLWQGSWEPVNPERFRQAQTAAERALALEPDLADAHSAISQVMLRHFRNWRRAREESARAVALAPTDSGVLADACLTMQAFGRLDQSIEFGQRAVAHDPVNADARLFLAIAWYFSDRPAEAKTEIRRLLELAPTSNYAHLLACMILLEEGRAAEALAEANLEPERMHRLEGLALAHFALGAKRESDAALAELKKDFARGCPYQIAEVYAYRNELDGAFEWLDQAWQFGDPGLGWIRVAPLICNVRKDPRWPGLLKKVGLSDEQLK